MTENKNEQQNNPEKSAWGLIKKILKWFALFVVVILALMVWAGNNIDKIEKSITDWQARRYDQAVQKYVNDRKAQLTADKDGGKTPEETLDLFIAALKAGDIEKASRYYVLEKQEGQYKQLNGHFLKGDINDLVKNTTILKTKGVKNCGKDYNYGEASGCTFTYSFITTETSTSTEVISGKTIVLVIPKGSTDKMALSLVENSYSHVWKISE